jgi:heptosyltransferase-2
MDIIIRMPNWLGDAVMATPVLASLRQHYKGAKITAMCQANIAPLLKEDPNIDEIFSYKRPSGWIHQEPHQEIIETIQQGQYDLGILLTNSFSSAWWFWQGKVKRRIGFRGNWRSLLLTDAVKWPEETERQHLVFTYQELLQPLDIPVSDNDPTLYLAKSEIDAAWTLLKTFDVSRGDTLVGINPGAAYGTAKCWLPERFRELTLKLLEDPKIKVVFFGDAAGASVVNEICADIPERVVNLAGRTSIRELMALIKICNAFLTNDSGPMHIAAALKTPLVALFGSTSDVKTGPYKSGIVIHKHVECSPCYKRVCPIDFRCMTRIEVNEVYRELLNQLKK